jgi:tetratricopeptide (TPR) repeat protein
MTKYEKAKKIYDRSLPPGHPNRALMKGNLGNVYVSAGQYDLALVEYESALKIQELVLPGDHPDIARTLHNLAVVHFHLENMAQAKEYLERAEETAGRTLSAKHPMMSLPGKTKNFMVEV